jgi:hypothetical protein
LDVFRDHESGTRVRLARVGRIDGDVQDVQVVGEWPRSAAPTSWYMSVDRDGSILLTATRARQYATVLFPPVGALTRPTRVFRRAGVLLRAPIVDDHSYAFVVQKDDGQLRIVRRASLRPTMEDDDCDSRCGEDRDPDDDALSSVF